MDKKPSHFYKFGPFLMDAIDRVLTSDGVPVPLAPKAFETLLALVEHRGRLIVKDELMTRVWPNTHVEEANLTQNVFTLRKVLGEKTGEGRYIETVPRRGYRFVASVREIKDEDVASSGAIPTGSHHVADKCYRAGEKSIAVLPFRIIGPRTHDEYLGLGLADALITKLSNLRQLAVRPTSAVCNYVGEGQDPISVGRELRVDSVLEGSVQKIGERLRLTVQLVSVAEGSTLWAEKFDERFTDIFALEDSISEQVARTLTLKLANEEKLYLKRPHTRSSKAYKHYLKGRFFWNKSRFFWKKQRTAQALRQSVEFFEQAIKTDANYALAYAGLADSYILLSTFNVMLPDECLLLAKKAALKALEVDGRLAEAHCSLATVHTLYDWDWLAAKREYELALELNPHYVTARHWYAKYLAKVGNHAAAMSEINQAQELDPLSLVLMTETGRLSFFARRYDQAIEQCLEALDMEQNFRSAHAILALAYTEKGLHEEALKHSRKLIRALVDDIEPMAFVGYTYGRAGRIEEARKVLEGWDKLPSSTFIAPFYKAVIHVGIEEDKQALELLEKAYEERSYLLTYLNLPVFDSLHSSPKFVDLLKRVRLQA
jgi:DNA-binding winged helix-turn-helix (wHTH) protein/tetratricopeptide (TPR) repeat protein